MPKSKITDRRYTCPNNVRHGELLWHPLGGVVCEACKAEHKPRSKTAYRFSVPNGGVLPENEVKE